MGGGTAGSVLANRLTSNPNINVLLIEAGSTFGPLSILPIASTLLQGTNVDWSFKTIPQIYSSKGLFDRQQILPRGKGLGGSSQINYMLHFDGVREDFDLWAAKAGTAWSYEKIKKYLDDKGGCSGLDHPTMYTETDFCLKKSEIEKSIVDYNDLSDLNLGTKLMKAGEELNFRHNQEDDEDDDDEIFNEIEVNIARYNIKNGMRFGVYHQHLKKAFHRPNLHILTNTRVHKILFEEQKAHAVLVTPQKFLDEKPKILFAKREIILSAGTIQTPHLLKLSGIGSADELSLHYIDLQRESSNVGKNLFDHINMPIYVSIKSSQSVTKSKITSYTEWMKYMRTGRGVLATTAIAGIMRSKHDNFGILLFGMGSIDEQALRDIANYKSEIFQALFPFHENSTKEGFILINTCYRPLSRGTIKLRDNRISTSPLIDPNYLHIRVDIDCTIKAIRYAVKLIRTRPFQKIDARIHWPKIKECSLYGPHSNDYTTNEPSVEYLECIIRYAGLSSHHPGGTAAMGNGTESVVDENLR